MQAYVDVPQVPVNLADAWHWEEGRRGGREEGRTRPEGSEGGEEIMVVGVTIGFGIVAAWVKESKGQ